MRKPYNSPPSILVRGKASRLVLFNPIKVTKKQSELAELLASCINTEQDFKKSNKFLISVEMQDPLVVAQVASYVVKNLTKYIIEYRTKKART